MAKKKATKTTEPQTATEESGGRASFIPQKPPEPDPVEVGTQAPPVPARTSPETPVLSPISIKLEQVGPREVQLTLTVGPLRPCIEKRVNFPLNASPEIAAYEAAALLKRAAESAATDGINQDYFRRQEDRSARDRFEGREPGDEDDRH